MLPLYQPGLTAVGPESSYIQVNENTVHANMGDKCPHFFHAHPTLAITVSLRLGLVLITYRYSSLLLKLVDLQ